jgi:hypothetical protein
MLGKQSKEHTKKTILMESMTWTNKRFSTKTMVMFGRKNKDGLLSDLVITWPGIILKKRIQTMAIGYFEKGALP